MGEVQCPPSITNRKEKDNNRQGKGAPSYEAGPPTSPGSRTPPYLQGVKREQNTREKSKRKESENKDTECKFRKHINILGKKKG